MLYSNDMATSGLNTSVTATSAKTGACRSCAPTVIRRSGPSISLSARRLQCAFGPDFVWIDHHISALEAWRDTGWEDPAGFRDTAHSAAWLSWHHLFAAPAPLAVTWVDKYDLWQQDAEWKTRTCPWQLIVTRRFSTPERYDLRVFSDERLLETYLRRYGQPMFAYEQQLRSREQVQCSRLPCLLRTIAIGCCFSTRRCVTCRHWPHGIVATPR